MNAVSHGSSFSVRERFGQMKATSAGTLSCSALMFCRLSGSCNIKRIEVESLRNQEICFVLST